jgi:hypothetical protein
VHRKGSRVLLAVGMAAVLLSLSVGSALAGELTGKGKATAAPQHANSICAFSGQEDLQFFHDEDQMEPKDEATKGEPGHAQSWGQIPKAVRDTLPAFLHPGSACNGRTGFLAGGH